MPSDDSQVQPSTNDYWQRTLREMKAILKETVGQTLRVLSYWGACHRLRRFERDLNRIRLELADEMMKKGVGDDHLRQHIAQLDDRIQSVTAASGSTSALRTERRGLQLRLTEPLLREDSAPFEIGESYARLQTAKATSAQQLQSVNESREHLFPAGFVGWRRLSVGVCFPLALGILVLRFAVGTTDPIAKPVVADVPFVPAQTSPVIASLDEKALAEGLGLVVCGLRVTDANGKQRDVSQGTGSAFAVTPDGYLLTNKHVVEEVHNLSNAQLLLDDVRKKYLIEAQPTVWCFFGKEKYVAEIKHVSAGFDLAILKVDRIAKPFFRLSNADSLPRATPVFALGFPGAARVALTKEELLQSASRDSAENVEKRFKPSDFDFVLTSGTVSRAAKEDITDARLWIQHNANIHPGNSGGPLVTTQGLVVGINTLANRGAAGVSFSLSIPQLRNEIERIVSGIQWE